MSTPLRYREGRQLPGIWYWLAASGGLLVVALIVFWNAGNNDGARLYGVIGAPGSPRNVPGRIGIVPVENGDQLDHPVAMERRLLGSVRYLASDELEGRGLGTSGIELAASYIADEFQRADLKTDHFQDSPFQRFGKSTRIGMNGPNTLEFQGAEGVEQTLFVREEFTPLSLSGSAQFELPVVFVGYGISAPEYNYDDYADIDVTGKAVLVLRHEPQQLVPDGQRNGTNSSQHAYLARKVTNAIEHGAAAVLFYTDGHTLQKRAADRQETKRQHIEEGRQDDHDKLLAFTVRGSVPSQRVPVVHVQRQSLEATVRKSAGIDLVALEEQIDQTVCPQSCALSGFSVRGKISVGRIARELKNVVATLDGTGPLADETIVIGAHYDHLGYGDPWASLAPSTRAIHNGADDNASGTAVVIELARQLAAREQPLARRLVFIAFTAEESGLVGSQYYAEHPLIPLEDTVTMLNFDMVGYLRNSRLEIFGTRTAPEFEPLLDKLGNTNGLELIGHPSGYGPSDHAPFLEGGVPVLHFFTGFHDHYHRPSDDYDKLNYRGMQRITALARDLIIELANGESRPRKQRIQQEFAFAERPRVTRTRQRVSMGLTGQVAHENGGYLVQQIDERGLAQKSGFRQGDRIIEIGSRKIVTEKDYTESVTELKVGVPVPFLVWRGQVELEINLLPY